MKKQIIGMITSALFASSPVLANSVAGSGAGSTTITNGSLNGVNQSLIGSVIASQALVKGSQELGIASLEALRLASELGRGVVITTITFVGDSVQITYKAAVNAAEVAQSLAHKGLKIAVNGSQQAIEFTVQISRQAFEASLKAAQQTAEVVKAAAKASQEVAIKVVYLTRDGLINTVDAASHLAHEAIETGGIVIGYTFMLAGSGSTNLGHLMTDFGKTLYGINERK
jgi:hypothetical protein